MSGVKTGENKRFKREEVTVETMCNICMVLTLRCGGLGRHVNLTVVKCGFHESKLSDYIPLDSCQQTSVSVSARAQQFDTSRCAKTISFFSGRTLGAPPEKCLKLIDFNPLNVTNINKVLNTFKITKRPKEISEQK